MAKRRAPKTLLEWNVGLALLTTLSDEQRAAGKRLPLLVQARLGVKAMPKAARVAQFIAMWTIVKYRDGEVTMERLSAFWDEPLRTMYRRLEEFRECWGPAGHDTPDRIADTFIADYKARHEKLTARYLSKLVSAPVSVEVANVPAGGVI